MKPKNSFGRRSALNGVMAFALLMLALGAPTPALAATPPNDDFDFAEPISSTVITMSDTDFNDANNGTDDPNVCGFSNPGIHTIWYSFTPTSYGQTNINTYGSSFDTILAVWTGTRGNLTEVACNDDTTTGVQSELKVNLTPGVQYYIEVIQYTTGSAPEKTFDSPVITASSTYMTLNVQFSQKNMALPGKYDDKNAVWAYTGTWTNTSGLKAYSKSFKVSKVINNTATVFFEGDQFKLSYTRNTNMGNLEISVDGSVVTTLSQNGTAAYQQVYTSPVFSDGIHTLVFKHLTKYVNVDAIEILAPPDLIPPDPILDMATSPGATYGSANLTWTATGDDGSSGIARAYEVRYSAAPIVDEATWNAATPVTTGLPTPPKIPGQAENMTVTGLGPGLTYFFAVRALDEPAPDATPGGLSNSPSSSTPFASPPAGAGIYDDKVLTSWMYFGTWTNASSSYAYGGSYRYSRVIGNSAALVFNGIKFIFTYGMNRYNGVMNIYVDGALVGPLNQYSSTQKWKQKYLGPTLALGQHTVQFIHATGTKVEVDAIQIIDTADGDPPQAVTNLNAAAGTTGNGSINLTWIAPAEDSTGSSPATIYQVRYSLANITDEAAWDAATPVTSGVPTPKNPGQSESMNVSGLIPGVQYYLAVRAVDEFENLGPFVTASARAKSPVPVGAGIYDNKDTTHWLYKGFAQVNISYAYNGSFHRSAVIGNTATFVFNGDGFTLTYTRNASFGNVDIYVDGLLVATLNQYNATTLWKQQQTYSGFGAGQHTVQFVHASGSYVNVDAITILP